MYAEVDVDLPNHPKSLRLSTLLKEPDAWLRMVRLWMWAMKYALDGDLSRFSDQEVAQAMGYPLQDPSSNDPSPYGALKVNIVNSGFMDEGFQLHDWKDRAKRLQKKKLAMRRLRSSRGQRVVSMLPACGAMRGEERKGEDLPLARHNGNGYTEDFEKLWKAVPKPMRVAKGDAFRAFTKRNLSTRIDEIVEGVRRWDEEDRWRKNSNGERCYPNLTTWINGGRYDDLI